jgi:predicted peroxiredoxin
MILYVQTSGTDTPERLYPPFVLAQTAKAMDLDAKIYFLGMGSNSNERSHVVLTSSAPIVKLCKMSDSRRIMA